MKFQILAAAFATCAAAAPHARQASNSTIADGEPFSMVAIRSGSELQYASFGAAQNSILLNVGHQNATCPGPEIPNDYATFYLSEGALYLNTPANVTQELYTDRSGMGQGVLQYSTTPGGYQPGRNSETTGWTIDEAGDLTFDGSSFIACPDSIDGSWSVWLSAGVNQPGGNTGCVGVGARTVKSTTAARDTCTYTYTSATA